MFNVYDAGYGDLYIVRNKKKKYKDGTSTLMASFKTRREVIVYCCKYILELCEREKDIHGFYFGIKDDTFAILNHKFAYDKL